MGLLRFGRECLAANEKKKRKKKKEKRKKKKEKRKKKKEKRKKKKEKRKKKKEKKKKRKEKQTNIQKLTKKQNKKKVFGRPGVEQTFSGSGGRGVKGMAFVVNQHRLVVTYVGGVVELIDLEKKKTVGATEIGIYTFISSLPSIPFLLSPPSLPPLLTSSPNNTNFFPNQLPSSPSTHDIFLPSSSSSLSFSPFFFFLSQ